MCYKYTLLHVCNSLAIEESQITAETDPVWCSLYYSQATYVRYPGDYGTIHDNNLIDVCPYEEEEEEAAFYNTNLRLFKDQWLRLPKSY
ncbi:uncharacterized protein RHIMIDRAFT_276162 [Rhizopus microsporus ATCC 52813]|uniref:Uncharacterized protein n=1 Tax=Rhizopus microsporus ATCC 52813 TaxID=1340429 RepID=A0A2G4T274_RHIZD|nr:uncharacterized protein RHIMIDRAFT_276162 [Rhizopus microsporus ATCC 52813]PHZ14766.1 hypothetical protein RHIMIDRAFT_276162 [Rhizopus microsporus ATCC 52813]